MSLLSQKYDNDIPEVDVIATQMTKFVIEKVRKHKGLHGSEWQKAFRILHHQCADLFIRDTGSSHPRHNVTWNVSIAISAISNIELLIEDILGYKHLVQVPFINEVLDFIYAPYITLSSKKSGRKERRRYHWISKVIKFNAATCIH